MRTRNGHTWSSGLWKWLQWLSLLDVWLLVSVRKHLGGQSCCSLKPLACIIFSITLFIGALLIQQNKLDGNEVKVAENKSISISPIHPAQKNLLNHTLQEVKDMELQSFKENEYTLTESSVRTIVQEELEKYDRMKRKDEKLTSEITEKKLQSLVNNELLKFYEDRLRASIMETLGTSVKQLLRNELTRYDADKMGIPDYALESMGGRIVSASDADGYSTDDYLQIFGINIWRIVTRGPRNIIQPNVHPGNCWAFHGSHASVVIQLGVPVHITAVTIEHIPVSISPSGNIDSAPKDFAVFGLTETGAKHQINLGTFTYLKDGPSRQYFATVPENSGERHIFKAVELWILSNHGNPKFTCVYRFRVHGQFS